MSPFQIALETHPPTPAPPQTLQIFPSGAGAFVSGSWSEIQYPAGFSFPHPLSFFFVRIPIWPGVALEY